MKGAEGSWGGESEQKKAGEAAQLAWPHPRNHRARGRSGAVIEHSKTTARSDISSTPPPRQERLSRIRTEPVSVLRAHAKASPRSAKRRARETERRRRRETRIVPLRSRPAHVARSRVCSKLPCVCSRIETSSVRSPRGLRPRERTTTPAAANPRPTLSGTKPVTAGAPRLAAVRPAR